MRTETLSLPLLGRVECLWAETPLERMRGLLGKRDLPAGTAMGFRRCNALHTLFMRFPIDVLFCDREGRPVKALRGVRPWRPLVWGGWRARTAYEAAAGSLPAEA